MGSAVSIWVRLPRDRTGSNPYVVQTIDTNVYFGSRLIVSRTGIGAKVGHEQFALFPLRRGGAGDGAGS